MAKIIAIVGERAPPSGGMAVQAEALTALLVKEGFQILAQKTNVLEPDSIFQKLRVVRTLVNWSYFLIDLMQNSRKIAIWHVFSNSYLSFFFYTAPVTVCGKLTRKPVIIHYHGGSAEEFFRRWGLLVKPFLRLARQLVVPSGFLKEVFAKFGFEVAVVPNIADLSNFQYRDKAMAPLKLLYTRHLRPSYNPQCALKAFSEVLKVLPDAQFRIAGDGSERDSLQALARELGVAKQVNFLGHVPNERLSEHYRWANMFVNSSIVDNQPVSILEAFASGLPVVTTNAGGIPHMVADGVTGIVVDVDHHKLAEAILTLAGDPELCAAISRKAAEEVKQYGWESIFPRWVAIYEQLGWSRAG